MFYDSPFNQPIGNWNTYNVVYMHNMFRDASSFDQPIGDWDTSGVTNMDRMFQDASSFNQDISEWCVSRIGSRPSNFDYRATAWTLPDSRPDWGTCPRYENIFPITGSDGKEYEYRDAHVFIANENEVNLPIPNGTSPIFVAVDGEKKDYLSEVKGNVFEDSIIHAIFDWNNKNYVHQKWFSDILQFGSRSEGDEPDGYTNPTPLPSGRIPNQLKSSFYSFHYMTANPAAISNLDVSNVTSTQSMFRYASNFNQPIEGWDVSNVKSMYEMFYQSSFNQPIGNWDTSKVTSMYYMFSYSLFNQPIEDWDVSNVTNMRSMFYKTPFNQPIGNWDVSGVENMSYMFRLASSFNQPIGDWDTSNVTDMSHMFRQASSFNQDLSQWCVSNVTNHDSFDTDSGFAGQTEKHPDWGTCPRGEDGS